MVEEIRDARILIDLPIKVGGRRIVAVDAAGGHHVFRAFDGEPLPAPEQSFTSDGAVELARRVLAGDEQAMTMRGTLRILAAALLVAGGENG